MIIMTSDISSCSNNPIVTNNNNNHNYILNNNKWIHNHRLRKKRLRIFQKERKELILILKVKQCWHNLVYIYYWEEYQQQQ